MGDTNIYGVGWDEPGRSVLEELLRPYDPSMPPAWHIETPQCDAIMAFIANGYRRLLELLKREAAAIGPKINPFDATLRRPAQSLSSVRNDHAIQPAEQD